MWPSHPTVQGVAWVSCASVLIALLFVGKACESESRRWSIVEKMQATKPLCPTSSQDGNSEGRRKKRAHYPGPHTTAVELPQQPSAGELINE